MVKPLVLGTTSSTITTQDDPLDATRQLALPTSGRHGGHLAQRLGGTLGGLLDSAPRNARPGPQRARAHHPRGGLAGQTRSIAKAWI